MKNFRDYLSESDHAASNPVAGDTFAINIREECLIESVVVESRDDGVVIAADDRMIELLESYGYTFEENCMECGMMECGCGSSEQYSDDESQDPGEYDQEGSMAKDDLNTIVSAARKLMGLLGNNDNMPEWTQSKIDRAADYVDTAADYIASKKTRGVMEQDVALPDIRGLGPDAQALILKLRRDVEDKRLQPTPQAVLAAARELAGDLEFAPLLLVQQVLGKGVTEGSGETSPVARATLHRIMMRHPGMLAQHGPERVMKAVDDVADLVGDMDDIGSSDISGWVNMVQEILDSLDQGVAEGPVGGEIDDSWMNDKHKEFYQRNPHFKRNNRDRVEVGRGTQLATRVDPAVKPAQVKKKPATPFGITEDLQADDGERYRSADDFFGQFEADHFDEERVSPDGMEVRGYIDGVNVMVWRFDSPRKTSGYGIYNDSGLNEAEYQGRKVPLGKPMKGDVAKSKVYVKDPKTGNVKKVNFGDPNMKIKKSNPARRKSFRARHNCDNPGPRTKARYWSCRAW